MIGSALAAGALYYPTQKQKPGPYEQAALRLAKVPEAEACDTAGAERRLKLARLLDKFHGRIAGLWEARVAKDFPSQKFEAVGPIFVRPDTTTTRAEGFDVSSWSWEEAQGLFLRTQTESDDPETKARWRDLDTSLRYLLEKDVARLLKGKKFLPPEATPHRFWPNQSVRRTGPREFTVRLNSGDFAGAEARLRQLLEREWAGDGRRVKVVFERGEGLYAVYANSSSARSYVNHRTKRMVIANYAWSRTIAHELGHILGFDDHYYNVWHKEHCYYTQESRLSDLMSNSEKGRVGEAHWRLLEKAYPWPPVEGHPAAKPFTYFMPDTLASKKKPGA
ncbi:MAG: hypothetical protein EOP11_16035 [Proteobacteria bacterium]|nr:MAG: hypothetical protein EOP11_16035 [Pseudomonadota bacterium]